MADTETVYILEDVVPYFETIIEKQESVISNQSKELEHLESMCEQLTAQTAIQQEQINGFSLIVNYQFATLGTIIIALVVALAWKVFSGWFFKGV